MKNFENLDTFCFAVLCVATQRFSTENFWHGSGEIGTGAKKSSANFVSELYTIFTVPKIPC